MGFFYSPSKTAFYPENLKARYIDAGTWPDDAVAVSEQEWQQYGQSSPPEGMQRGVNNEGRPVWVPAPEKSLPGLATQKRREINTAAAAALKDVRSQYPDFEQISWLQQEQEARTGGGTLIETIAEARGLPLPELIDRIIAKSDAYQRLVGKVIGQRQALEDAVDIALRNDDRTTLEQISWKEV